MAGTFNARLKLEEQDLVSNGFADCFITTLGDRGEVIGARSFGASMEDRFFELGSSVLDRHLVAIQSGHSENPSETVTLHSIGPLPQIHWSLPLEASGSCSVASIVGISDGSNLVAINFEDSITIADEHWKSRGGSDILLVQIAEDGSLLTTEHFGGPEMDRAESLYITYSDTSQLLYMTGTCGPSAQFKSAAILDECFFGCLMEIASTEVDRL